jgi:hypothetical protein
LKVVIKPKRENMKKTELNNKWISISENKIRNCKLSIDEETAELIYEVYSIPQKQWVRITGRHDVFPIIKKELLTPLVQSKVSQVVRAMLNQQFQL